MYRLATIKTQRTAKKAGIHQQQTFGIKSRPQFGTINKQILMLTTAIPAYGL